MRLDDRESYKEIEGALHYDYYEDKVIDDEIYEHWKKVIYEAILMGGNTVIYLLV